MWIGPYSFGLLSVYKCLLLPGLMRARSILFLENIIGTLLDHIIRYILHVTKIPEADLVSASDQ